MTALLEEAIREVQALPDSEQDHLAALVLENLRDGRRWDAQFAASKDVLEELYDEAMADYALGRTRPLQA
jgi:hypothetical protein